MKNLSTKQAEAIHTLILQSGEKKFVDAYLKTLKSQSELRQTNGAETQEWRATPVPASVKAELQKLASLKDLADRNLISEDGTEIELRELCHALSDATLLPYYTFDPAQRAKEAGIDLEAFRGRLKAAFRGTVGTPSQKDYAILLDKSMEKDLREYYTVVGLSMCTHPYDQATIDRLSKEKNLDEYFRIAVQQGKEVIAKKINPQSVYIVTPEMSPLAVKTISTMLGLPKPGKHRL
jgi:hypothetical protein